MKTMFKNARDYGPLNVYMRSQRTMLFSAGTYNLLASATDLNNLRQMLAQTNYHEIIGSEMVKDYPNLIEIDRRLTQNFVDQFNSFRKFVPPRSQQFITAFGSRFFLNNIKVILSGLYGANRFEDARGMLISLSEEENRQTESLFAAKDIPDLISRLENPALRSALEKVIGEYRYLDIVYPLIIAIDQFYYDSLCNTLQSLKGADYRSAKRFFEAQIGIQNLEIILRSKAFGIQPAMVKKWLIYTQFCPLSQQLLERFLAAQDFEETFKLIKEETAFKDLANRLITNLETGLTPLANFDLYADQHIVHIANSIFRGASFNITIYPAFFFLKEIEIRNLRTIILGKIHDKASEEILDKIILL
ncbi:hypothetical protein DRO91_02195 [Candidatus Heimdallarchaeota archaeon]|nr:MAG: hypothetical protein DRO91_02195 [Candidatus Heimdallarchaeota archaeon]